MSMTGPRSEEGFTMIATVIGLFVVAMLAAVAVTATNGDTHSGLRDFEQKQAYEAAKAGIDEYAYHLHVDNGYWAKCANVSAPVNQQKPTTMKKRKLSGSPVAEYGLELIPATGYSSCDSSSVEAATESMLQATQPMKGTFRIRSTGFYGEAKAAIMATFKPASFLDFVYFTQLETSDPVTYGPVSTNITNAKTQCSKTIANGRMSAAIPNSNPTRYCDVISFIGGDEIKGPMHTNDTFAICESPSLGRNASDRIEIHGPPHGTPPHAWYQTEEYPNNSSRCGGTSSNFKGTEESNAEELIPPKSNAKLASIADPSFKYKGQVRICLEGANMTVGAGKTCTENVAYKGALPSNGVVYVESGLCEGLYSPYKNEYPETSTCGDVYVHGSYSKPLTIASANNIIIDGNLTHTGEESMLGLIANNFIRIYHPTTWVDIIKKTNCHKVNGQEVCTETKTGEECTGNAGGSIENITIEAALLAIEHSIIVDNYGCGKSLGTLTVIGALAQNYRGAVGSTGENDITGYTCGSNGKTGCGYVKNYNYDERLKTMEPPSFIEPVQSDWVVGRETNG
jgi:type II secretory pathway pseudopilin PulG